MADWDAFRAELEGARTRQLPFDVLRERRRRRMQRRAIAGTFAVVMAAGATSVAILGEDGRRTPDGGVPVAVPTALTQVVNGALLAPPKDYKDYVVTDVDFVSPDTGWAVGLRCVGETCDVATWRTDDGARTWSGPVTVATAVPRSTYQEEDPSGGGVRSLRMVDTQNGYAFNPDLYRTRDGGRTWDRMAQQSKVTSVSVAGTSVWVTERGCAAGVDCDVVVRAGIVGGRELRDLDVPETNAASAIVRRASEQVGYLVMWDSPSGEAPSVNVTTDGGRTWNARPMPCDKPLAVSMTVREGWEPLLVCTSDAGRTAFRGKAGAWERLPDPPSGGVVTDLVLRTETTAYLTTQTPGRIYRFDGTWTPLELPKAYGYSNLDAVEEPTTFAMGDAGQLWRSYAATRWERLPLPPAAPRPATPLGPRGLGGHGAYRWKDVSFIDAQHGWALGHQCTARACNSYLRSTADGGDTWRSDGRASNSSWPVNETGVHAAAVDRMVFADASNGWTFGTGMFATHDGGRSWRQVRLGFAVLDVVPRDGVLWAVSYLDCDAKPCGARVHRGTVGSDVLPLLPAQPDVGSAPARFVAVDAQRAFLVGDSVAATTDGGRTWTKHALPCPRSAPSATPSGSLWLVCAAATETGAQSHAISNDGGATWARTPLPGKGTALGEIVAVDDKVAFRSGGTRGVLVTHDGGAQWEGSAAVVDRVTSLEILNRHRGWLIAGNVLYRTTDGVTWERLG